MLQSTGSQRVRCDLVTEQQQQLNPPWIKPYLCILRHGRSQPVISLSICVSMHLCMCVCVCPSIYVCTCLFIHPCMYVCVYSSIHVCMYVSVYLSFHLCMSLSIHPSSNEHSGLISFGTDWFDLFAVQGSLTSLLQ